MTPRELIALVDSGEQPIVQFNKRIEDWDGYFDAGMKARIVGTKSTNVDDVVEIFFDFSEFEAFNDTKAQATYWDEWRMPTMTAREAGCFPKDCKESVYIGIEDNEWDCPFTLLPHIPVYEISHRLHATQPELMVIELKCDGKVVRESLFDGLVYVGSPDVPTAYMRVLLDHLNNKAPGQLT